MRAAVAAGAVVDDLRLRFESLCDGPPHLAVHQRKQQQIVRTAQWFLAERRVPEVACRFDVLAVTFLRDEQVPRIDWVRDAFPAEGVRVW